MLKGNFAWWKYTTTLTVITPWLLAAVFWRWIILSLLSFNCASLCKINFPCSQPGPENRSALQGAWLHGVLGQKSHLGPSHLPMPVQGSSTGAVALQVLPAGEELFRAPPSRSPRQTTGSSQSKLLLKLEVNKNEGFLHNSEPLHVALVGATPCACDSQYDTGNTCSGSQQFHVLHLQKHFNLSNVGEYSRSQVMQKFNELFDI